MNVAAAGILAGKRAGMRVIGVAATHPPAARLEAGVDAAVGRWDVSAHPCG